MQGKDNTHYSLVFRCYHWNSHAVSLTLVTFTLCLTGKSHEAKQLFESWKSHFLSPLTTYYPEQSETKQNVLHLQFILCTVFCPHPDVCGFSPFGCFLKQVQKCQRSEDTKGPDIVDFWVQSKRGTRLEFQRYLCTYSKMLIESRCLPLELQFLKCLLRCLLT